MNDMNILQVVYQQLPIEVNCVSLLLYPFIYLYICIYIIYFEYEFYTILHQ